MQIIPREVSPHGRDWTSGEEVKCITNKGSWKVGLVLSNGCGRFSSGWNKFVRDNHLAAGK